MKNRRAAALAFDEASSGSDNDNDSSNSDDEEYPEEEGSNMPPVASNRGNLKNDEGDEDDDSSSSSSSDDSDSGSEPSDSGMHVEEDQNSKEEEDSEDAESGSEEDGNSSGEDLPLHERVRKKEERGLSLQTKRERKSRALELASERLAKLKRSNLEKNDEPDEEQKQVTKKKKSKHAPTEVSSKRADYFKRGAPKLNESGIGVEIGAHKYKPLDPRTSNLSGHLNEEQFEQNYSFLDEIRNKEISRLKKQIGARKVTGKKGKKLRRRMEISGGDLEADQEELKRLQQEKAEFQRRKLDRAAKQSVKRKIRDEVEHGKRGAYFLKRKDQRRLTLEAKLEVLREQGGDKAVEKAVAKRRRKNKSRDAGLFAK